MLASTLALAAALSIGASDYFLGLGPRRYPLLAVLVVAQLTSSTLLLAAALTWGGPVASDGIGLAVLGASLHVIAMASLAAGLAIGPMSLIAPLSGMNAIVPVTFGVLGGEELGAVQVAGICACLIGIVLIGRRPGDGPISGRAVLAGGGLLLGLVAMLAMGLGVVVLSEYTEVANPFWVIANSHAIAAIIFAVILALAGRRLVGTTHFSTLPLTDPGLLLIGALAAVGVLSMTLALDIGSLSVVGVLVALYPAVTVVLARTFLHERLSRAQGMGATLVLTGIIALTA